MGISRQLNKILRAPIAKMASSDLHSDLATVQRIANVSMNTARCARAHPHLLCAASHLLTVIVSHPGRFLFYDWDVVLDKKDQLRWSTNCPHKISDLFSLEGLKSLKAYGSIKLLNARLSKPAETAMLAMPPCTACLKTNPAGDRMLIISCHLAILSQVRPFCCPEPVCPRN